MTYSDQPDRRPVRILRIATPADVADAKLDPGVYRASRSPGRTTVLCEYVDGEPGTVLCNLSNMLDDGNGMERSAVMNALLGGREGMTMVTKELVDSHVFYSRRLVALKGDPNYTGGPKDEVIAHLADENDRLRAQLAEAVALLNDDGCFLGREEWEIKRAATLARIGATP